MRILTASISLMLLCSSCMYTINMAHTEGTAEDIIDDTATPTVTTDATVPVSL